MLLSVAACLAGVVLLTVAADLFVLGAARLAVRLRVRPVVVGAVIIGFGTSSPELLVAVIAAIDGQGELALGSVVGSNAANLTLVVGVAALITPLAIGSRVLRRELPLTMAAALLLLAVLVLDPGRWAGLLLACAFALALWLMLWREPDDDEFAREAVEFAGDDERHGGLRGDLVRLVGGLVGTIAGAQALVWGAERVADEAGLSGGFVGLTLVAVGTSLPEVATAVQAARRGEGELVVGNVLGSCLFNGLAIAGLAVLIAGSTVGSQVAYVAAPAMVVVTVAAAAFMRSGRRLGRLEGLTLFAVYLALLVVLALT